jgi:hypothetical protein
MRVTVHYLFSKNDKIGSKIISWGTKHLEPTVKDTPSHTALLINNRWVHESTLETGVRVISYDKWKQINTEVAKIECSVKRSYPIIKKMYQEIRHRKYDWMGIIYQGIWVALNKFFKKPIPEINRLEDPDKYFCCEVVGRLTNTDCSMKSPVQLMVELNGKIKNVKKGRKAQEK